MKWNQRFRGLLHYYIPYKGIFFKDLFFSILSAVIMIAWPLIARGTIQQIFVGSSVTLGKASTICIKAALLMLVLILVESYCKYYTAFYGHAMGAKMEHDMRNELYGHYMGLSMNFFNHEKVGQLMSRVTSDLNSISELLHHGPEDVTIAMIKFFGSFVILANIHLKLTFLIFAVLPIMFVYTVYHNKRMRQAFSNARQQIGEVNSKMEDSLSGIRVVKTFTNEELEVNGFKERNRNFLQSKKASFRSMGFLHAGIEAFLMMIVVFVVLVGGYFTVNKEMSLTDLITFLLYIDTFSEPVRTMVNFTEQLQDGISGYQRFCVMMQQKPDIVEAPDGVKGRINGGEIQFENVSFQYNSEGKTVLDRISFTIHKGEYIGLVGLSGAGKSTLCNLIPRLYDVTKGKILVDGVDVRDWDLNSLRQNIGIVEQDVYLFNQTVLENIRYGKPDATDEECIQAAKLAYADDFIIQMEDGYQTPLGQRGVRLSGGQKQRIAIARLFLKNPRILILDEATSALDNESERIVSKALEQLAKGRTTVVIAHRLSTLHNASRIIVLSEQGIMEQGSHNELCRQQGVYWNLYQMQFQAS